MLKEKKQVTEQEAWQKLSNWCAKAEHSSGEMRQKMMKWGMAEDVQERILERLLSGKYIDDERFAHAYAHDKLTYDKWGRRKIEQGLYQKGVSKDIYGKVLDEISDERYIEVLKPLLLKKWKTIKGRNDYECAMKLMKYALGRGFELSVIRKCIDDMEIPTDD